jgi:membrane protease subunit (stomatin/prohibitin family)
MGMGMGMVGNAGLGNMTSQQPAQVTPVAVAASAPTVWTCACGQQNNGNFCTNCGSKKPSAEWTCGCGAMNKGKFCSECGTKKPE